MTANADTDTTSSLSRNEQVKSDRNRFDAAIQAHDEAVAASGIDVWIGAEPTFTDRQAESPEWLSEALGETKQTFACNIIRQLRQRYPGSIILRTLGRQYAGEPQPRWSLGLYRRRDGRSITDPLADSMPTDPLSDVCACDEKDMITFWQALASQLTGLLTRQPGIDGRSVCSFRLDNDQLSADQNSADQERSDQENAYKHAAEPHATSMPLRILFRTDGKPISIDPVRDTPPDKTRDSTQDCTGDRRLLRTPVQSRAIPPQGIEDDLAADGFYLVSIGCTGTGPDGSLQPCIELPGFTDVQLFEDFVQCVASAANVARLSGLVWRGFPPPVDASVAWMTLTPDPAVLEVNEAPASSVTDFLDMSRMLFDVVQSCGLAPYRLNYNGDIAESGGGGQFTLGGPSAEQSPFFVSPHLLSRLIVYLNHHPSLSYWFAPIYVGSYSQSPRTDENVREMVSELQVALQHLAAADNPAPEFIWRSLSPFLVDTSGNAHRSEINIEKLWNPYIPGRGCLGLVEFRAFRMVMDAESAAAIAALLRAIAVMLAKLESHDNKIGPALTEHTLIDWGSQLHDRFALPYYQLQDLESVFTDLRNTGLSLGEPITERLRADSWRHVGDAELAGCRLDVELAIEFWPLLGDAAEHTGGSRLVDASTRRLQLTLRKHTGKDADPDGWRLQAGNYSVPLRTEQDESGKVLITGLRYRAFVPWVGLHPGLDAQTPIVLYLLPPDDGDALRCTLHDWHPENVPYDGLPADLDEARRRIAERFVVETITPDQVPDATRPPEEALTDYCLDLRRT
jgi:uncharacterized protein (DUF2126 family)